jgi:iron complex outermembrane receptor protein
MKSFALSLAGAVGLCAASSALAQAATILAEVKVRASGASAVAIGQNLVWIVPSLC